MMVFGTAFFSPSCLTASTKQACSCEVQTRRGRLSALAWLSSPVSRDPVRSTRLGDACKEERVDTLLAVSQYT